MPCVLSNNIGNRKVEENLESSSIAPNSTVKRKVFHFNQAFKTFALEIERNRCKRIHLHVGSYAMNWRKRLRLSAMLPAADNP